MALIEINKNPSKRDLRVFMGVWFPLFFALLGAQAWRKSIDHEAAAVIWISAGVIALAGLAAPPFARLIYLGISYATYPVGWVVSHLVLGIVFFLVVTPTGWIVRRLRGDSMRRGLDRTASTYWTVRGEPRSKDAYFRQY